MLQTGQGHSGYVSSVAFSPDGTRIVSASEDGKIKLWDASDLTAGALQTGSGHSGGVRSVAFSPAGIIVSGSSDDTIKTWYLESGGNVVLENTTLRACEAVGLRGGGLHLVEAKATLNHVQISDCLAADGGALFAERSTFTLRGCELTHNSATNGAAAVLYNSAKSTTGRSTMALSRVAANSGSMSVTAFARLTWECFPGAAHAAPPLAAPHTSLSNRHPPPACKQANMHPMAWASSRTTSQAAPLSARPAFWGTQPTRHCQHAPLRVRMETTAPRAPPPGGLVPRALPLRVAAQQIPASAVHARPAAMQTRPDSRAARRAQLALTPSESTARDARAAPPAGIAVQRVLHLSRSPSCRAAPGPSTRSKAPLQWMRAPHVQPVPMEVLRARIARRRARVAPLARSPLKRGATHARGAQQRRIRMIRARRRASSARRAPSARAARRWSCLQRVNQGRTPTRQM